ncbi:hypothetical protein C8Q78DRAFT_1049761 [Trametes maxima]|nr:hypothetical protein C8Q78DRAFT_1049761 [Trametes maxima]
MSAEVVSFRRDFKEELLQHVVYAEADSVEDAKIMSMLFDGKSGVSTNPGKMDAIFNKLLADSKVKEALKVIEDVSREDESSEEETMYPSLENLFAAIDNACATVTNDRPYFRKWVNKAHQQLISEDFVFPENSTIRGKPDFVLAEMPRPHSGEPVVEPKAGGVRWRQCSAFLEIKSTRRLSPHANPAHRARIIKETLAQGADYARLILNARPFQLYVYGIFFCGDTWCLAYFDRRGVVLGHDISIFDSKGDLAEDSFAKFVRVVLRMSWEMSLEQLGHDPTVTLLDGHAYYDQTYPQFLVNVHTDNGETEEVCTYGTPVWSSLSLIGRGSSVYRAVSRSSPGNSVVILKNAWRSVSRHHEAYFYKCIDQFYNRPGETRPAGVARLLFGGDVKLDNGEWLSVKAIRGGGPFAIEDEEDVGLHRVVVKDYGKPLWSCTSPVELARAMLMALDAHQSLSKKGLLHCDISAGNILIRQHAQYIPGATPHSDEIVAQHDSEPVQGFLMDFELASLRADDEDPFQTSLVTSVPSNKKVPGRPITGTAIFASTGLLEAITKRKTIPRTSDQDVESFAWVFIFSLYRMALSDATYPASDRERLEEEFQRLFSAINLNDILDNRVRAFHLTGREHHPGISSLCGYLKNEVLRHSVVYIWYFLFHIQPQPPVSDAEFNPLIANDPQYAQDKTTPVLDVHFEQKLRKGLETIIKGRLPATPGPA